MQIRYFWLLEIKSAESRLQKANCVDLTTWVPQKEYCSYHISIWNKVMKLIKIILRQAALDNLKMNCMVFSCHFFPPLLVYLGFSALVCLTFWGCSLLILSPKATGTSLVSVIFRGDRACCKYVAFVENHRIESNTTGADWNKQSLGTPQVIKYDLADSLIGLLTSSVK